MFLTTMQGGGSSIEVKHRFLKSQTGCFVPCLSLISISSYVVQGTKETGNIYNALDSPYYLDWEDQARHDPSVH